MKIIRNKSKIIILILVFFSVYTFPVNATTENDGEVYRFVANRNFPPYEFIDSKGEFVGFNVDIINAISQVTGIDIEIIPMEWKDALESLEGKTADGIIGMAKDEERMSKYNFTSPTLIQEHVIFVNKDTLHITFLEDLVGQRVAYQKGNYNEEILKDVSNIIHVPKADNNLATSALGNGEVDAVLGNKLSCIYFFQKNKLDNKIKMVGEPVVSAEYGPAVVMGNDDLLVILEKGLELIKENKTYDKIYKKWFGEQANYINMIFTLYKREITFTIGGIILIFLLLYIYNKRLQNQVFKRTSELEAANKDLLRHQREVYNLAYYDSITSLPNRTYFVEELNSIFERPEEEIQKFAILFLDLDRFKHINDTLGHNIGDYILKLLGTRLEKLLKEGDIVARVGGDEYYILMNNINDEEEAINMANQIIGDFKIPYHIRNYELYLTTSIGIAIYPEGGLDTHSMIKNADLALYKAKEYGGNSYYLYGDEIKSKGLEKMLLLNQLRQALENDQFVLHYQPQIDIETGNIMGVEALVRWEHPEKGLLYPDSFIGLAEETGIIIQMGEWILKKACIQAKEWLDQGYDIKMSVNISAKQFQHRNFIKEIIDVLTETKLNPKNLTLEITETIAISDMDHTLNILTKLKNLGIAVAIDDFGTGYSSLSYLNDMSVNELKIDRSFIWDIERNNKNKMISNTIIILAKQLGLRVIAEGVENIEQLSILKEMECDIAQGYHFSRPVSIDKIDEMIFGKSPI